MPDAFGTITLKGIGRCTRLLKRSHSLFRRLNTLFLSIQHKILQDLCFSAVILARWKEGFFIKETFVEEEAIVNPFVNLSEFELF